MTRIEYFELAKEAKKKYENKVDGLSLILKSYPRNEMGLVLDQVKESEDYKKDKKAFDNAFNDLRNFNTNFIKTFKVELKKEREEKRKVLTR